MQGRHAIVTGGGRGIGRAIAEALTRAGASVTILGRSRGPLDEAVRSGSADVAIACDVTNGMELADALQSAAARRPVDILVNNAGTAETGPFLKQDQALAQRMLDQHLLAPMQACRLLLPGMIARGHGRILNIASILALKGQSHLTAYGAAKHAMLGFTRSLAVEVAATGVTVNAVCPGYTVTELVVGGMTARAAKKGTRVEDELARLAGPLGRLVTPEEVASACVWLAADGASGVTGQHVVIDGGDVVA